MSKKKILVLAIQVCCDSAANRENPPQPIGEIVEELLDRYFRVFPEVPSDVASQQLVAV